MEKLYRIYGKANNSSRFRALNVDKGTFATNLVYASMWKSKELVDKACYHLSIDNPHMEFEVRIV